MPEYEATLKIRYNADSIEEAIQSVRYVRQTPENTEVVTVRKVKEKP